MTTVFPYYADVDLPFTAELSAFLERGADLQVFLEDGVIKPDIDLVGKARDGRMADIVVVLLSPDSVPSKWVRSEWEEAFITAPKGGGRADRVLAALGMPVSERLAPGSFLPRPPRPETLDSHR